MQSTLIGMAVVALFSIAPLSAQAARPGVILYEEAADLSERLPELAEPGSKPRSVSLRGAAETGVSQPGFSRRRALLERSTLPYVGTNRLRYAATYKRMRYAAYYRDARERCCTIYSGKARHTCIGEARMKFIQ
ncbi:MAG: hypothetical protein Q7T90_09530 [Thiobacillus sp.]|nr:hypothetical protein [Thiobacillus sp.]